ncbi:hypothetical protein AVEN_160688-1 [Araneus ventricosus]|uniref:Uncharacterized protein n=1 Tax=Araneus ventricosus TaxID=182803 RepID=A0A4Y2VZ40_ARAVE|nr:hypothetical protein AVEN_160688-1 [Araneus ventricosus]
MRRKLCGTAVVTTNKIKLKSILVMYLYRLDLYCTEKDNQNSMRIVTNMENRFRATLVLWLGREFYRGKCGLSGSSEAWTPYFSDKLDDHFGDKFYDLGDKSKIRENANLSSISQLGEEICLNVQDDFM